MNRFAVFLAAVMVTEVAWAAGSTITSLPVSTNSKATVERLDGANSRKTETYQIIVDDGNPATAGLKTGQATSDAADANSAFVFAASVNHTSGNWLQLIDDVNGSPQNLWVIDFNGVLTTGTVPAARISGAVATATALAANGANCSAGNFPLGVDASGAVESCTALSASNAGTATALAANGANCSAGNYPLGVDASGAVESCTAALVANADNSFTAQQTHTLTDAGTNTVLYPLVPNRQSSGTPANGIGVGIPFDVETSSGNTERGCTIEAVTTDVTSTSEDFDLVVKCMAAGSTTLVEVARFRGTNQLLVKGPGTGALPSIAFVDDPDTGVYQRASGANTLTFSAGGTGVAEFDTVSFQLASNQYLSWSSGSVGGTTDVSMTRDATGVLKVAQGSNGVGAGGFKYVADSNGGFSRRKSSTEQTTLSTGAATTATSGNLAVASSEIKAIMTRVTTSITTAANYGIKVTGGNAFCVIGTANTTTTAITSGSTTTWVPCAHADAYNASATTLTITLNATPGAGVIRESVVYEDFSPPSS